MRPRVGVGSVCVCKANPAQTHGNAHKRNLQHAHSARERTRVLEREPRADAARRLRPQKRRVLVGHDLAADSRLLEDVPFLIMMLLLLLI